MLVLSLMNLAKDFSKINEPDLYFVDLLLSCYGCISLTVLIKISLS